ncbi:winged helix-turn-helix domain-containing protein [Albidovulum sediminicola]|uniref:Winged helix-turn-helix domain-containing protein n=1 Tax=Albidovulum sediminicola TaxID=2984331 RepID=A0ABT2Z5T7_9RHOB|nr:winged helix-turn-helix domain-containing protein [Defluviimonas sp. WL0075]MCV2866395.1 winged helix-turn-helix domain-containing protein [Defluviimonas sp. WL0075]
MSRKHDEIEPKSVAELRVGTFRFIKNTKELLDAEGQTVPLRSQSADVLAYLADRPGDLVTKAELIEAVWPDTFVTDDSLVQCIGDIRRALGDKKQRLVQTYPKKGYRLVDTSAPGALRRPALSQASRRWALPAFGAMAAAVLILFAAWVYKGAADLPVDLGDKPRIAVLSFDDFSVGPDKGYLSDAIAEGVITELARSSRIAVIARNSSFRYRDSDADVRQIGQELGVHYIVEGSQQKSGDSLKVTVQLILAASGEHLWAHTYDQEIGSLFAVQDAIVKTVADRIGVRIERPVPGSDPAMVSALHFHLQGIAIIHDSFDEASNAKDLVLNRRAIEADPGSQFGYIGLAHGYRAAATFGWQGLERQEALRLGLQNAKKALRIAPDDAAVHFALARLYDESGDRAMAMASFDKAIALNPSASNYLVGSTNPMLYAGQAKEAVERLKQAMGIDPFHQDWFHWQMGWALWELQDCEGALAAMMKMKKIDRGAHRMLAGIYACLDQVEKAQEAYKVFYAEAHEPTISEQRAEWQDIWTAPGSLDRWLDDMRVAGMKD